MSSTRARPKQRDVLDGQISLTLQEAAEVLVCHTDTVRALIRSGQIKARRPGRRWLVNAESVREYLSGTAA